MKIFAVIALVAFGAHAWPTSVDEANSGLAARRKSLVQSWVAKYKYDQLMEPGADDGTAADKISQSTGFDHWKVGDNYDPKKGIRKMAAGFYVFTHPSEFSQTEYTRLGNPADVTYAASLATWQAKALANLKTIKQFAEVGTETEDIYDGNRAEVGDYDFLLKELITIIYAFRDYPGVLTNEMVETIIMHPFVSPGFVGSTIVGKVVASGQDPTLFTTVRARTGSAFFTVDDAVNVKTTQGETENHVLMIMCWRYLVQNYLEWVAGLPSNHPRKSTLLTNTFNSDRARYENTSAFHTFMVRMLGRFLNNGTFETCAKPYESITIGAIQCLYSYAHVLFPQDTDALNVRKSAENALNVFATQFAFQSIGGKRLGPMRRNYSNRGKMHPYASDYVANIFGILSGAYKYSDETLAATISTTPQSKTPFRPYMYQTLSQPAGFALWSCLMDYRIPEVIHDFMVRGTSGHWMRLNPHYLRGDRNYGYSEEFVK